MQTKALIATLTSLLILPLLAAVNPPPGANCSANGGCGDDGDSASTGNGSSSVKSLNWSLNVGIVKYGPRNDFRHSSREGAIEGSRQGAMPRTLDAIIAQNFSSKPQFRSQMQLEFSVDKITADLADPAILDYNHDAGGKVIEENGFVNQILTDDALTNIEKLADGDGFKIRMWHFRDGGIPGKTGDFYNLPAGTPLTEITFSNPDHPADNGQLDITTVENRGASPFTSTTRYTQTASPDVMTVETFAAATATGSPYRREIITYSNRGAKIWDCTIEREVWEASVNAMGTLGALVKIKHDQETYKDFSKDAIGGQSGARRQTGNVTGYKDAGGSVVSGAPTTTYTYIDTPNNRFTHGRLESVTRPNGSWEYHEYNDSSAASVSVHVKYSSWKDVTMANRVDARKVTTEAEQSKVTRTTTIAGQQVALEEWSTSTLGSGDELFTKKQWDGNDWHVTTTGRHAQGLTDQDLAGRVKWVEYPDGTAATYAYVSAGTEMTIVTVQRGAGDRNGVTAGTSTETTYGAGFIAREGTTADIQSGETLSSWEGSNLDQIGRPRRTEYNGNALDYSTVQYGCCGIELSRDRSGATTTYSRDPLKRVYRSVRKRSAGGTEVATTTTFTGLETTTQRTAGATTLLVSEITRSLTGLTTTRLSPDANNDGVAETTTRVMVYNAGGSTTTTTHPDTTTSATTTFIDGSTKSSTDQAGSITTYDKNTHAQQGGGLWSQTTAPNTTQWTKTYSDHLGRSFKTEFPDGAIFSNSYHLPTAASGSGGKLASTSDPDENAVPGTGTKVSYGYDAEGERSQTTEQMPDNQQRVTQFDNDVVNDPDIGISHRRTTTLNGVLVSTTLSQTIGYASKSVTLSGTSTSTRTFPDDGEYDGEWITTSVGADGVSSRAYYSDGLMKASVTFEAGAALPATAPADITAVADAGFVSGTSTIQDAFGRTLSQTDSRTGTTTMGTILENGSYASVTDPGGRVTEYTYDVMGRLTTTELPDNTLIKTSFTDRGQVAAQWGSQTYPTFRTYDAQGRPKTLRTKPTLDGAGKPTNAGGSLTTWIYDTQRGWLTEKNYDGETDDGTADVDYTYTAAGRILTRDWERGVTTTYGYDAGMLETTDYSDSTLGVTQTYDNFGRPVETSNGVAKTTYAYDAATLVLNTETVSYDIDGDSTYELTRVIDRHQDNLLRPTGFDLKDGATVETQASYTYDAAGRLGTVTDGTDTFTYGYQPESNGLVKTVTGSAHTVTNSWETTRNVLASKENKAGSTVVSDFAYTVNSIGQRSDVSQAGTAFAATRSITWGYDALGQVVSADSTIAGLDRAYQYDMIGNRLKSADSLTLPSTANYTANALNQYTAVDSLTPSYDDDGNATAYPLPAHLSANSTLVWDAENRLISATVNSVTTTYRYDSGGRRIATVATGGAATLVIYDGWNPIAEYAGTTLEKSYLWGMDLSGSMQGAGGVGGLLLITDHSALANFFPTYDGNGNVSEYLDSTGTVKAHYEYDPFGRTTVATGTKAQDFAHRFSTKPLDAETGLYYYGYRYYDPVTGRWPSRDPIEEDGGINLYAFVGNDGVNHYDLLGWAKYYVGRMARSLAGGWISVPAHFTIAGNRFSVPFSSAIENVLNVDAGHHNVAVWCEADDGTVGGRYILGLFADDFKEAGIGAAKQALAQSSLAIRLIEPSWLAASWVDGHLLSPVSGVGSVVEKHVITKDKYDAGLTRLKGMEGSFQSYSLFFNNCQNFADLQIRLIK